MFKRKQQPIKVKTGNDVDRYGRVLKTFEYIDGTSTESPRATRKAAKSTNAPTANKAKVPTRERLANAALFAKTLGATALKKAQQTAKASRERAQAMPRAATSAAAAGRSAMRATVNGAKEYMREQLPTAEVQYAKLMDEKMADTNNKPGKWHRTAAGEYVDSSGAVRKVEAAISREVVFATPKQELSVTTFDSQTDAPTTKYYRKNVYGRVECTPGSQADIDQAQAAYALSAMRHGPERDTAKSQYDYIRGAAPGYGEVTPETMHDVAQLVGGLTFHDPAKPAHAQPVNHGGGVYSSASRF